MSACKGAKKREGATGHAFFLTQAHRIMATFKDNYRRAEFEGASFYIDVQSDEMMGGQAAHVYACSVRDHGILHGVVGGVEEPEAPERAGSELEMELLETIEDEHYADIDCTVYHGIAGPRVKQRLRPADLWMEWLAISGHYTGPRQRTTTLRIRDGGTGEMYDEPSLDRRTVERILRSAAQRLSQGRQNVKAEKNLADQLTRHAFGAEEVSDEIHDALRHLADRLEARHSGRDLSAVDARGPTGEDWWSVGP